MQDTDDFSLINGLLADGIVYCKIRINSVIQYTDRRLDLNNEQYYLFLAAGSETGRAYCFNLLQFTIFDMNSSIFEKLPTKKTFCNSKIR